MIISAPSSGILLSRSQSVHQLCQSSCCHWASSETRPLAVHTASDGGGRRRAGRKVNASSDSMSACLYLPFLHPFPPLSNSYPLSPLLIFLPPPFSFQSFFPPHPFPIPPLTPSPNSCVESLGLRLYLQSVDVPYHVIISLKGPATLHKQQILLYPTSFAGILCLFIKLICTAPCCL